MRLLVGLAGERYDDVRNHGLAVGFRHVFKTDDLGVRRISVGLGGRPDGNVEVHGEVSKLLVDELELVAQRVVGTGGFHDVCVVDDDEVRDESLKQQLLDVVADGDDRGRTGGVLLDDELAKVHVLVLLDYLVLSVLDLVGVHAAKVGLVTKADGMLRELESIMQHVLAVPHGVRAHGGEPVGVV